MIKPTFLNGRIGKFQIFIIATSIFKLILMGLFSSDYQNKMFIPFVDHYLKNLSNTYSYYYQNNLLSAFPYPPLMLYIESIGGQLLKHFPSVPLFFKNVYFKLPSLIMDFVGLYYVIHLSDGKRKYAAILYFASPIIIYAVYMHSQLDIIPTGFLFGALYYITRTKSKKYDYILFVLFLAAAISTKFHILAILPLIFLFVYKKHGVLKALVMTITPLFIVAIIIAPFWGQGFIEYVLFNNEQNILTRISIDYTNVNIYIPVIAVLLIYLYAYQINNINKDLLIGLSCILYAIFLALIPPMPAWYVWVVPFIMIFIAEVKENKYKILWLYVGLNGLYLTYFVLFHDNGFIDLYFLETSMQFLKQKSVIFKNLTFTALSSFLLINTWNIYKFGIASNSLYKRRNLPFTIGISGDSGSGKSQALTMLENLITSRDLLYLEGDGDHRWERGDKNWNNVTQLNPKANYLYRQAKDIEILRTGAYVNRVEYDHHTGKFTQEKKIFPKKYIVISGLHSFYLPQMRNILDLKIFMDTDETLRKYWKIQRDITSRGYSKQRIIAQIEERLADAKKYINPQKEFADLIISYYDNSLKDCMIDKHKELISVGFQLSTSIDLEQIVQILIDNGLDIKHEFGDDLRYQYIYIEGESIINSIVDYQNVAENVIPQLTELLNQKSKFDLGINGLVQLIILVLISSKMKGNLK